MQVYGARAFGWRGAFAVHTWIAIKRQDAPAYTTYEVTGWRAWHGHSALGQHVGAPDRYWFGAKPKLYVDLRGAEAEALIDKVEAAIAAYPFKDSYVTWPGPNSNTFTDVVARRPDGALVSHKLLSENPERYADAAIRGIRDLLSLSLDGLARQAVRDTQGRGETIWLEPYADRLLTTGRSPADELAARWAGEWAGDMGRLVAWCRY